MIPETDPMHPQLPDHVATQVAALNASLAGLHADGHTVVVSVDDATEPADERALPHIRVELHDDVTAERHAIPAAVAVLPIARPASAPALRSA
jgi:hypothetical protein